VSGGISPPQRDPILKDQILQAKKEMHCNRNRSVIESSAASGITSERGTTSRGWSCSARWTRSGRRRRGLDRTFTVPTTRWSIRIRMGRLWLRPGTPTRRPLCHSASQGLGCPPIVYSQKLRELPGTLRVGWMTLPVMEGQT